MSIGARVFVLVDLKGGVGKTVTAVGLAACFAAGENLCRLMVGLDPQANAAVRSVAHKDRGCSRRLCFGGDAALVAALPLA